GSRFPYIHRCSKWCTQNNIRIGAIAAIYFSAILEYLTADILDLAGNASKGLCHAYHTTEPTEELDTLVRRSLVVASYISFIRPRLLAGLGRQRWH
ncbi:hypothetical protein EDB84DRAFT_1266067, partial [Lactarius hengduanensis]